MALPSKVTQEVVDLGIGSPVPTTRTGLPLAEITVTGLSVMTTVITLAQSPAVLEDVAHRLTKWRRHTELSSDPVVSVDAVGPNGRISLQLTSTTSEEEVAHVISLVLSGHDANEPSEGTSLRPQDSTEEQSQL